MGHQAPHVSCLSPHQLTSSPLQGDLREGGGRKRRGEREGREGGEAGAVRKMREEREGGGEGDA